MNFRGVLSMEKKKVLNNNGFTLLELMLVLLLCSLLVSVYIGIVSQSLNYYQENIEKIRIHENLQYSLHFIEKNLRQLDQQQIEYSSEIKQITSENSQGQPSYMDFSGKKSYYKNTYFYYHSGNRQLRINRDREHNVLAINIDQVKIREVIPGNLVEISLSSYDSHGKEHSLKSKIRINARR